MTESDTIIAAVITAMATVVSVLLGQYFMNRKRKLAKNCIIRETTQNANVYTALEYIMGEMGADRAYIMEFHNGDNYFSGRHQQKYSCTHEVVEEGVSSECELSQNHRVSNYHSYIHTLTVDNKFIFEDIEEVDDRGFYQLLKNKGVKSIYNVPVKTLNGKIIGILGVDYVKEPIDQNNKEDEVFAFMKRQARLIAGYLM